MSYNKIFLKKSKSNINEKTQILISKPVYLGLSISEISKIGMYEFWHDYVKPEYNEKTKLYYMDTVSLKTEDILRKYFDVEKRFDISTYELESPLPKGKNKKVIGLMKKWFRWKIIKEFVGLRAKT